MTSGLIVGVTTPHVNIEEGIRIISFLSFSYCFTLPSELRMHGPSTILLFILFIHHYIGMNHII